MGAAASGVGAVFGGIASGVGTMLSGMFVSNGISDGADTMSDGMCRAAVILSEAGLKSANLHAKITSEAIISSMRTFGDTMDDSFTRNTFQAMKGFDATITDNTLRIIKQFDATISDNTLLFIKHFDGNVDKLLDLLAKESLDWQEVVMKVRLQLSSELWWAKATLVSVAILFALILFPMWLSPEQVRSVQEYVVGVYVKISTWFRANVLRLIGFCVVVLITYSFLCAHWNTKLTMLRMDAQRILMLKQIGATRSVPVGTVVPFYADPVPLRQLGWAVCDGTTPAHQEIFGAVLKGPTPVINDNRFVKGVSPDRIGVRNDDATTLMFGTTSVPLGSYTHEAIKVPTNGGVAVDGGNRLPFSGSWGLEDNLGTCARISWDKPEVQPKSIGLTYIILVK